MKAHAVIEEPPRIGENPKPLALARFILWQFLQMPGGGLYAKWNAQAAKGTWIYSQERDYMFREPRCDSVLYEEHNRARFRSLVFRFASLGDDGLCGAFEFQKPGMTPKKYLVHTSFYPETGVGLWVAITSMDEPDGAATQPSRWHARRGRPR